MESVVVSLMLLALLGMVLKISFYPPWAVLLVTALVALFTAFSWPWAIAQSKTQIADWLSNPALMADTAVLLTVEVALQMAFCFLHVNQAAIGGEQFRHPLRKVLYRLLCCFPGMLHLLLFFSLLVFLIFHFPGVSFPLVAACLAAFAALFVPLAAWGMRRLLPAEESRLEMLFLTNALLAALGVVATVNGRTAVAGVTEISVPALLLLLLLLVSGGLAGLLLRRLRFCLKEKKNNQPH